MSKMLRIMIIAFAVIIVILTIILIVAQPKEKNMTNTATNIAPTNTSLTTNTATEPVNTNATPVANANINTAPTISPDEAVQQAIRSNAISFAQIYGSYSTHEPYTNLEAARILMSASYKKATDAILAKHADDSPTMAYYGVETRALSATISNYVSNTSATVLIKTQRRESVGTSSNGRVSYEDLALTFVTEQGVWKVDSATWDE